MISLNGCKIEEIRYSLAYDYERLCEYLDYIASKYSDVSVSSIGATAEGRMIPVVRLGSGERGNVYVGGMEACDVLTPAVLLRFICDYVDFYTIGRRMYGINMQYLWKNRTIHIIPMLNPDGYMIKRNGADGCIMCERLKRLNLNDGYSEDDYSYWKYNACGKNVTHSFVGNVGTIESEVLKNYIEYYSDTLDSVLDIGADCGILYSSGKNTPVRAKTVARLLSRMSGYQISVDSSGNRISDYVITQLDKNAYHIGCLDDGESLPTNGEGYIKAYAALREALFSCPLL